MKRQLKATVSGGIVGLALVAGMASGTALASVPSTPGGLQSEEAYSAPSYETNSRGLTFGSSLEAAIPEDEPDLILAIATSGEEGYVLKTDLDEADGSNALSEFSSPQDANAWQTLQRHAPVTIPVYSQDGITVIGEFEVSVSEVEVVRD